MRVALKGCRIDTRGPWPVLVFNNYRAFELVGAPQTITPEEGLEQFIRTQPEPIVPYKHGDQ